MARTRLVSLTRLAARVALVLLVPLTAATADERPEPLPVFVLVGQSNMQGHAHVRTLEALGMDPETVPLYRTLCAEDGTPRVCEDVWISSLSSDGVKHGRLTAGFGASGDKIGPEFAFGVTMQKRLGRPILLIKTAWGGKNLHTDFRPPSAGAYVFTEAERERLEKLGKDIDAIAAAKAEATGRTYRLMRDHVRNVLANIGEVYPDYDAHQGYELAGFVWFQGWNDMVDGGVYPDRGKPGGYDRYSEVLTHFIGDVRREFSAPDLPFVIGVLGVGGPVAEYGPDQQRYAAIHQGFRDAMAAPAANTATGGHVAAVLTETFWDHEVSALLAQDAGIRRPLEQRRKRGAMTRAEEQAALENERSQAFTARERRLLDVGVSHAAYHYLGSAKILSRIGRAFAEALPAERGDR